ncbi:hypothetical protein D3C86_1242060 [compost metagenome]
MPSTRESMVVAAARGCSSCCPGRTSARRCRRPCAAPRPSRKGCRSSRQRWRASRNCWPSAISRRCAGTCSPPSTCMPRRCSTTAGCGRCWAPWWFCWPRCCWASPMRWIVCCCSRCAASSTRPRRLPPATMTPACRRRAATRSASCRRPSPAWRRRCTGIPSSWRAGCASVPTRWSRPTARWPPPTSRSTTRSTMPA